MHNSVLDGAFWSSPFVIYGLPALLVILLYLFRKHIIRSLFSLDEMGQQILAEKKSSEVRIGNIVEAISPVLDDFPVDIRKEGTSLAWIGRPVDFIHFDPDEGITFIEVKSGNARLSRDQKKLRALIRDGRIKWAEFRVK